MDAIPSGDELTAFLQRAEEAADAYVRGDMARYVELVHHAPGFTLLAPLGGPASTHEDRHAEIRAMEPGYFADGEARHEHVETHAWSDTLVLVMIERQHGRFAGRPDQDLSLRVTHVYRRDGDDWLLVHRHADPLVRPIQPDDLSALLRGASPTS